MYGKALSIPDTLIDTYSKLLLPQGESAVSEILGQINDNPRKAKRALARQIVASYFSQEEAENAEHHFDLLFVHKKAPDNLELFELDLQSIPIIDLLVTLGAAVSKSEARRMIQQNSVTVDDRKIEKLTEEIELFSEPKIIRAGKRKFFKVAAKK